MSPNNKTLEAKCLCGSVHFNIEIPKTLLPLEAYMCHCSICRYYMGTPCIFHTVLPSEAKTTFVAPSSMESMRSWPVEEQGWMFCPSCGCHITAISPEGIWTMSNSILTDHSPELVQIKKQYFTKSAKGGGLSSILTNIRGQEIKTWNPPDDSPQAKLVESKQEFGPDGAERLRAECLCGGVSFTIRRPDQAALDDEPWRKHVFPLDKSKWSAAFDLCNACRLADGAHVTGWMSLPRAFCEPQIGPDLKIGTMKTYESSPGVLRSFCGTCSATFFFQSSQDSPSQDRQVVDLATGVLRAPEGVMAENWLGWRSKISWLESGENYDRDFAEALQSGMKKWVIEKYGQEVTDEA